MYPRNHGPPCFLPYPALMRRMARIAFRRVLCLLCCEGTSFSVILLTHPYEYTRGGPALPIIFFPVNFFHLPFRHLRSACSLFFELPLQKEAQICCPVQWRFIPARPPLFSNLFCDWTAPTLPLHRLRSNSLRSSDRFLRSWSLRGKTP